MGGGGVEGPDSGAKIHKHVAVNFTSAAVLKSVLTYTCHAGTYYAGFECVFSCSMFLQ